MVQFVQGKWPANKPLPEEVKEYMVVIKTGWTLEYVRQLSVKDHDIYELLSMLYTTMEIAMNKNNIS